SSDGLSFVPEPAPVLNSDIGGEAILVSPQVMVDGTVYKMWYSFVSLADFRVGTQICDLLVSIGYATSSDGFYWVRSPRNSNFRALWVRAGVGGWDAPLPAFLANTALPIDGSDPRSGIALYYTPVRPLSADAASPCVSNGIGRASRP